MCDLQDLQTPPDFDPIFAVETDIGTSVTTYHPTAVVAVDKSMADNTNVEKALVANNLDKEKMNEQALNQKTQHWTSYMDVLLIFTGLFAGVVTAFVILSMGDLQDPQAPPDLLPIETGTNTPATMTAAAVTVNALWLSSLSLSLLTAVCAMWGKLWVQRLLSDCDDVKENECRWEEIKETGNTIITILPFLIHTAIILFMAGLVLFLWDKIFVLSIILLVFLLIGVVSYFRFAMLRKTKWYNWIVAFRQVFSRDNVIE